MAYGGSDAYMDVYGMTTGGTGVTTNMGIQPYLASYTNVIGTGDSPMTVFMSVHFENKRLWVQLNVQKKARNDNEYALSGTLALPIPEVLRVCMEKNMGIKEWAMDFISGAVIIQPRSDGFMHRLETKITGVSTNKKSYLIDFRITSMFSIYNALLAQPYQPSMYYPAATPNMFPQPSTWIKPTQITTAATTSVPASDTYKTMLDKFREIFGSV